MSREEGWLRMKGGAMRRLIDHKQKCNYDKIQWVKWKFDCLSLKRREGFWYTLTHKLPDKGLMTRTLFLRILKLSNEKHQVFFYPILWGHIISKVDQTLAIPSCHVLSWFCIAHILLTSLSCRGRSEKIYKYFLSLYFICLLFVLFYLISKLWLTYLLSHYFFSSSFPFS